MVIIKEPITVDNVVENIKVVEEIYNNAQELLKENKVDNDAYNKCIEFSSKIIKLLDDMNPFQVGRIKHDIKTIYFISSEILIRTVGLNMNRPNGLTKQETGILYTAVAHLQKVLSIDPLNIIAKELFKIVFIYLTIFNPDIDENIKLLKHVLMVNPCDYQLQYNLGFMYGRGNDLENSLMHLKLAIGIVDYEIEIAEIKKNKEVLIGLKQFKVKCLNGIGGVYFSVQDRELANYYFYKALDILPNDPDIHNQIGVVYTELRYTDKAIHHYKKGIENFKNAHISNDLDMLLASMYMNMGLAYCYEINYPEAIECYNKALKYKPRLSLAYQNKLLDLNYISHLIEDPMYIAKLHKNINKMYPLVINDYKIGFPNYKIKKDIVENKLSKVGLIRKGIKLNIGLISGDFIAHPVSYFLTGILNNINYDLFNVHCFSLKVVNITDRFPKLKWHVVKGTNPEQLKNIIQSVDDGNGIDILFDLSSQTGDNRLDTFVLKPAPIQISYCGYANTSGLTNMDYHIVDRYTDSDGKTKGPNGKIRPSTQKYYSEKLIFMDNCFLNYTSSLGTDMTQETFKLKEQPAKINQYLTIGTFNRYNKINDNVVNLWERILKQCPNVKFVIKTKEFLTDTLRNQFVNTWKDTEIFKRVQILPYADLYQTHLVDYNLIDIAVDTFPYSGTTTSCESLLMGVPCITLFDEEKQFHCQNVTSSLMINSNLEEYVVYSEEEFINKVEYFSNNLEKIYNLKQEVRDKFINGHVCNYTQFTTEFENKLLECYKQHTW